jgi:hypothetical protein
MRTGARKAHADLSPLGLAVRESRDSTEHPNATAIALFWDVTGSMQTAPQVMMDKLPALLGTILRFGYAPDPQILFGAIGDATCDSVPFQTGQFESDNRIDEVLGKIFLEGGGGGNNGESYALALYFLARHTSIDCWEKHGEKGFAFLTGDENPLPEVTPAEVLRIFGDTIQGPISIEALVAEVRERYHLYFLHINNGTARYQRSLSRWQKLLGDDVISLQDPAVICETVAMQIGLVNGVIGDVDEGADHLRVGGSASREIELAASALRGRSVAPRTSRDVVTATGTGVLSTPPAFPGRTERL